MNVKKIISTCLAISIFSTSLTVSSSAISNFKSTTKASPYSGKVIDIENWVDVNIPSFNGVPYSNPSNTVFYSGKGELKLKINEKNQSYFENGGSVTITINQPKSQLHLNPLNWKKFLSFKPATDNNKLAITSSENSLVPHDIKVLVDKIRSIPAIVQILAPPIAFIAAVQSGHYIPSEHNRSTNALMLTPLVLFNALRYVTVRWLVPCAAPLINLIQNVVPSNEISAKYGVVLTSKDDEIGLDNSLIPKVGDINYKKLEELARQKKIDQKILDKIKCYPSRTYYEEIKNSVKYSQEDIDDLKEQIEAKKPDALNKLETSMPIRSGVVCKLDAKNPTQTFRFVINNAIEPHNADLFAIALANPNINLKYNNSSVTFDTSYSYKFDSLVNNISKEIVNDPALAEKVKVLTDTGTSKYWWDRFSNSISQWFTIQAAQPAAQQPVVAQQPAPDQQPVPDPNAAAQPAAPAAAAPAPAPAPAAPAAAAAAPAAPAPAAPAPAAPAPAPAPAAPAPAPAAPAPAAPAPAAPAAAAPAAAAPAAAAAAPAPAPASRVTINISTGAQKQASGMLSSVWNGFKSFWPF